MNQSVNLVIVSEQPLAKVGAVLASDSGDEGFGHAFFGESGLRRRENDADDRCGAKINLLARRMSQMTNE